MRNIAVKIILIFLFIMIFPLTSCQGKEGMQNVPSPSVHHRDRPSLTDSVTPLTVDKNTFQFIVGWLNEREILLYELREHHAYLSSYNVITGNRTDFFVFEEPIITAQLSPSRNYLLIHSSPTPYEAELNIFRTPTKEKIATVTIPSSEITYEWNPYSESKIFVTAFQEDWSYSTYVFEFLAENLIELDLSQPFAIWFDESALLILNWDWDEPNLSAPLVKVTQAGEEDLFPEEEFIHFQGKNNVFLGIQADKANLSSGEVTVFDKNLQKQLSFSIPLLTNFSGWEIPFYEILPGPILLMIEPNTGGEADIYNDGFRIVKRDFSEEEVLLENMDNGPLVCAPDGKLCLTGYQLQNIIRIDEKTIKPFLIFQEGE